MSGSLVTILCTVITALVSVSAIFISNLVGQRIYMKQISITNNQERYKKLYLPLIHLLYNYLPGRLSYGLFQSTRQNIAFLTRDKKLQNRDPLVSLIMENSEFATPDLLTKCIAYSRVANNNLIFNELIGDSVENKPDKLGNREKLINELAEKSPNTRKIFNELIQQILLESRVLAKMTGAVDLTEPLLEALDVD